MQSECWLTQKSFIYYLLAANLLNQCAVNMHKNVLYIFYSNAAFVLKVDLNLKEKYGVLK